ncbi:hypothetical protein SDJN03_27541, partial [Cucurbita argyrosperma subsp. sororia]
MRRRLRKSTYGFFETEQWNFPAFALPKSRFLSTEHHTKTRLNKVTPICKIRISRRKNRGSPAEDKRDRYRKESNSMHSGAHVAVRDDSDHSVSNELIVIAFTFPSILIERFPL